MAAVMTAHDHLTIVPGCFRCDLNKDGLGIRPEPLTEFLLARFAEDEASARTEWPFNEGPHLSGCCVNAPDHMVEGITKWCDCGYPARVLADLEAKRRRVALLAEMDAAPENLVSSYAHHLLCIEADPYADHPAYREEWT